MILGFIVTIVLYFMGLYHILKKIKLRSKSKEDDQEKIS